MMRLTVHCLIHSALFLSRLWSAHPATIHRSSRLTATWPAEAYHRSTAPADSADPSAREQGSAFVTEPSALRSDSAKRSAGTRGEGVELTRRLTGNRPTSLDLTFHMLREMMETSRAERMSQKAKFNKNLLKALGKRSSRMCV